MIFIHSFKGLLFLVVDIYVYTNIYYMCLVALRSQRRALDHLEMELHVIMSHPTWVMGTKLIYIPCKRSIYSIAESSLQFYICSFEYSKGIPITLIVFNILLFILENSHLLSPSAPKTHICACDPNEKKNRKTKFVVLLYLY